MVFGAAGGLAGFSARCLLGRLRRGARVRAPLCELVVGAAWACSGGCWAAGRLPGKWLPLLLGLAVLGVAAGATDLRHRRLPDVLTLPAAPAAVLAAVPLGAGSSGRAVLGALALCGAHVVVRAAAPGSLGAGDVKLAGPVGAALAAASWPALALGCTLASLFTLSAALAGWLFRRRPLRAGLPHGPSMLLAGWLVCLAAAAYPPLTSAPV